VSAVDYRPADRLHLWLLTVPSDPVPIGELNLVRESRGVSLRYADTWLERGFALSEDLPLIDRPFLADQRRDHG
jgi:serine/threonine-protein kinase HipA